MFYLGMLYLYIIQVSFFLIWKFGFSVLSIFFLQLTPTSIVPRLSRCLVPLGKPSCNTEGSLNHSLFRSFAKLSAFKGEAEQDGVVSQRMKQHCWDVIVMLKSQMRACIPLQAWINGKTCQIFRTHLKMHGQIQAPAPASRFLGTKSVTMPSCHSGLDPQSVNQSKSFVSQVVSVTVIRTERQRLLQGILIKAQQEIQEDRQE